jgi:NAD+ synthase (glutamine-hydrolysing)
MIPFSAAIGQFNPKVGDIQYNLNQIRVMITQAVTQQIDLIIFPELALIGYPCKDLLFNPTFIEQANQALDLLRPLSHKIDIVIGHPTYHDDGRYNSCLWLSQGQMIHQSDKRYLPNNSVFNESRYFEQSLKPMTFISRFGVNFATCVCEDIWHDKTWQQACTADYIIVVNASPFHLGKVKQRRLWLKQQVKQYKIGIFYANIVGAQDGLIFDGDSQYIDTQTHQTTPLFKPSLFSIQAKSPSPKLASEHSQILQAITLGITDYFKKHQHTIAWIGLSGGIDSAITAILACQALGSKQVNALILPGPYTAESSVTDAIALAKQLGISYHQLPITKPYQQLSKWLDLSSTHEVSIPAQNLQSRLRSIALMTRANQSNGLVLCTANKSELACGYGTLYGDLIGAIAPIGDLYKTELYQLADYLLPHYPALKNILSKPPSAELKPGQIDQDDLPPYQILDQQLSQLLPYTLNHQHICQPAKFDILSRLNHSEFKRKSAPPIIRISQTAFNHDRHHPTNC